VAPWQVWQLLPQASGFASVSTHDPSQ
jgi:hypothetical protein